MADPLGNVTKLPARAARGAGKSKPSPEPARMKPAVPKAKVRSPDEAAREAAMTKLVGWRQEHQRIDNLMDALKAEIAELNAEKKQVRGAIQTVIPLAVFDEAYSDAKVSRVDLVKKEDARMLIREAYGLAAGKQADILEGLPEAAKPAVHWESQGYQDGISGSDAIKPEGCPPENLQDYLRGHSNAMTIAALGLAAITEAEPEAIPFDEESEGDVSDKVESDSKAVINGDGDGDDDADDGDGEDDDGSPLPDGASSEVIH